MTRIAVQAQGDFLERLAARGRPAAALAELVWNGLDADATEVRVELERSLLGPIASVRVSDDGEGMSIVEATDGFAHLGGSWKRGRETTRGQHRLLHGKDGKGRFRAFALGATVEWCTVGTHGGENRRLTIRGTAEDLQHFDIGEPEVVAEAPGTNVTVRDIWEDTPDLTADTVREELAEVLAPYLMQYPHVRVLYDGAQIEPRAAQLRETTYPLDPVDTGEGSIEGAELMIIEWLRPTSRSLYLCDEDGFTLSRVAPHIQAPGFHFTAYLRAAYLRDQAEALSLGEIHAGVSALIGEAKNVLRRHFRGRLAASARETVEQWKKSDIYPYEGEAQTPLEEAERQVFDVVAYNVASYLPQFAEGEQSNQKLSFRLLKSAIEENPRSLRKILDDVLRLPKEQQDELAELLERTSLSAIITAAKEVADRLDFLRGLELLVFNPISKKQLLERSQLHRILVSSTWLFGEDMRLAVDDQSLTEVLRRHLAILRKESSDTAASNIEPGELAPVLREDGSVGIVDLMLSRRIPHQNAEHREHLVVELKRPAQVINPAVAAQLRSYAFAVQSDDRFRNPNVTWKFWAVSNRITEQVRWEMEDEERGILKQDARNRTTIYLRTWGEVIDACRSRLTFFQERLQYVPRDEDAISFLRTVHDKYIPPVFSDMAKSDEV